MEGNRIRTVCVGGCGDLFPRKAVACGHANALQGQSADFYRSMNAGAVNILLRRYLGARRYSAGRG
jgi:hypothetical protein